ncbi:MAG TPA: carboxypeptidase regulatory-like domain-containing protein, partial [Anditalea sp.]|nr:carboxypeptidase regulatory-like domain-containing protein [Anditalea sp.]
MKTVKLYGSNANYSSNLSLRRSIVNRISKDYNFHKIFWTCNNIINPLILLIVFGLSSMVEVRGQCQVNGHIQDISGKPIAFANVLLLSPADSSIVKGSVSNENGAFQFDQIQEADYLISVSLLGFKKHFDRYDIECNSPATISPITLLESEEELEEIEVSAQLPLYERKIDRMVINVQASITSAGNTVMEVLQKSPGVMVNRQSNSILLNGKPGVTIMINNRIQRLPMEVVFQMLDGMSAANIEKIELITNPPSKYDAEGMGGIIHLLLSQSEDLGTNGNFGVTAGYNAREILAANFNLNHRKEKLSFFV